MKLTIVCEKCGTKMLLQVTGKLLPDQVKMECPKCGCYHFVCIESEQEVTGDAVPTHLKNKLETK